MNKISKLQKELEIENKNLRAELAETKENLRVIQSGEVDAFIISGAQGEQVFTLKGVEQPYRVFIEQMKEGAATLAVDNTIIYCNNVFAGMLKIPLEKRFNTYFWLVNGSFCCSISYKWLTNLNQFEFMANISKKRCINCGSSKIIKWSVRNNKQSTPEAKSRSGKKVSKGES
jgi:hypothetical protein